MWGIYRPIVTERVITTQSQEELLLALERHFTQLRGTVVRKGAALEISRLGGDLLIETTLITFQSTSDGFLVDARMKYHGSVLFWIISLLTVATMILALGWWGFVTYKVIVLRQCYKNGICQVARELASAPGQVVPVGAPASPAYSHAAMMPPPIPNAAALLMPAMPLLPTPAVLAPAATPSATPSQMPTMPPLPTAEAAPLSKSFPVPASMPKPPVQQTPQAPPSVVALKYLVHMGNEVKGPYARDQINALLDAGVIHVQTPACAEGENAWRTLGQLIG